MSRRFNINAKNDRSLGNLNRYNNKVTSQQINNNNDEENETENTNNNGETVFNKPKKIVRTITDNDIGELKDIKIKMPVATKVTLVALIISILLFAFLLVFVTTLVNYDGVNNKLAAGGYYDIGCNEVTVNLTDKDYNVIGTGTYPLEEYVAGVVTAEVGQFNNLEVFKEFAIAARSYFAAHHSNCTIESSNKKQVFSPTPVELARQAADETAGKVLLQNDSLYGVQYDAFCSIAVSDTEYTLKQKNQKIPRSWVDSQPGIAAEWKQGTCAGNHGNGLSQWGSLYLATMQNMKYDEILKYYLGNNITISSSGIMSIAGLEIKNTTDASVLHEPLNTFLPNHGSSVEDLNNFIATNVNKNGNHTRAGVVTAAVSLVNYLYDGAKVRLPYYWGGQYQHIGVDPTFGGKASHAAISAHGNAYHYNGFDCSGFVSWAIKNGGFDIGRHTTAGFHRDYSGNSCNIGSASCKGQPGDLINSNGCHVQMIVSVDESSGLYYVAESTGSAGLIMRAWGMHEGNCGSKETRILHMNSLYGD